MDLIRRLFSVVGQNYFFTFLYVYAGGAGFELFKIHFTVNGVNYYTVFKRRQLERELAKFEKDLKETEEMIAAFSQSVPS